MIELPGCVWCGERSLPSAARRANPTHGDGTTSRVEAARRQIETFLAAAARVKSPIFSLSTLPAPLGLPRGGRGRRSPLPSAPPALPTLPMFPQRRKRFKAQASRCTGRAGSMRLICLCWIEFGAPTHHAFRKILTQRR